MPSDFCHTSAKSLFQMFRAGLFTADRVSADLTNLMIDGWRAVCGERVYFNAFGLNMFDIALATRVLYTAENRHGGILLSFGDDRQET